MTELLKAVLNLPALPSDAWTRTAALVLAWSADLALTWEKIIGEPLSADDFLTMTIAQLPEDKAVLQKAQTNLQVMLDQAVLLNIEAETAYAVTTLCGAISIKLTTQSNLTHNLPSTCLLVLAECRLKDEITEIRKQCEEYKKYLYENIRMTLKNEDGITELYYFGNMNKALSMDEVVLGVAEDIKFKMLAFPFHHDVPLFLKKYFLVNDMVLSLVRQRRSSSQKQIEFAEKFIQHKEILQRKNVKPGYFNYEFIPRLAEFFGWLNKEEWFLKTAGEFALKVKRQEGLPFNKQVLKIT